ncbi:hypothetical protein NDU88_001450 [Pleurodeles waltl]|uniref:Uncharacterized protein n=1 Tax=Pleurodeles waltl TaxID=8319 RepID=A0AAV7SAV3_PLEWA|nr:hypothetical protein NDU88_001450 [Pleurodeles waltl]
MAESGHRGSKCSRTGALLEVMMLSMDATDQAIALLKSWPPVPKEQVERARRAGGPLRDAFPPVLKTVHWQKKSRVIPLGLAGSKQVTPNQDPICVAVALAGLTPALVTPGQATVQSVTAVALATSQGVALTLGGTDQMTVQGTMGNVSGAAATGSVVRNVVSGIARVNFTGGLAQQG